MKLMRVEDFIHYTKYWFKTCFGENKKPILGTIILTDYCNLSCKHCAVNNINKIMFSYDDIVEEMKLLYNQGIRVLFFCGGETTLWKDKDKNLKDLIKKGREIGFKIINIVTNGTITLDIPEADIVFLSIDGDRNAHNIIRGDTFDTIINNLEKANNANICIYMAINSINYKTIRTVADIAKNNKNVNSISFNFHTPYEDTEKLILTQEQKIECVKVIKNLIKESYPVFNLYSALDYYLKNNWKRPCYACMVSENKKHYVCGRCVEINGLCNECGYLFAVEFSLIFSGNIKIIFEMFKIYFKFLKRRK